MIKAHSPAEWNKQLVYAVQALAEGTANEGQQKDALRWIIEEAARSYDLSYQENDTHATAFMEGRRHVGMQIVKLTKLNPNALKDK